MKERRFKTPNPDTDTLPPEVLDQIEADPRFIRMMAESDRDEREGRVVSNEEALQRLRADIGAERRGRRRRA